MQVVREGTGEILGLLPKLRVLAQDFLFLLGRRDGRCARWVPHAAVALDDEAAAPQHTGQSAVHRPGSAAATEERQLGGGLFGGVGRGWELFPSGGGGHGTQQGGQAGAVGSAGLGTPQAGDEAKGGVGEAGLSGGGNMSLLDELYTTFASSGVGSAGHGQPAGAALGSRGGALDGGQWNGGGWDRPQHQQHQQSGEGVMGGVALDPYDPRLPASLLLGLHMNRGGEGNRDAGQGRMQGVGMGAGGPQAMPNLGIPPLGQQAGHLTGLSSQQQQQLQQHYQQQLQLQQQQQQWRDPAILAAVSSNKPPTGRGMGGEMRGVVPFQPPLPPPVSLTRGALALASAGPPAALPAANLHGFDVAAAAAAAAGRGLVGAQPSAAGMVPVSGMQQQQQQQAQQLGSAAASLLDANGSLSAAAVSTAVHRVWSQDNPQVSA